MPPSPAINTMSVGGATYDLFVQTDHSVVHELDGKPAFTLPLGTKIRVGDVRGLAGGGACNSATGLARLGCNAAFCGVIGSDAWGQSILASLQHEGVHTQHVTVVENETTSFSVLLRADTGERVTLYEPGVNAHLDDVTFAKDAAAAMDWIILNHLNRESCDIQDDVVDILVQLQKPNLTWNPGGCQIERGMLERQNQQLLAHTTILLLNMEEAMCFTGVATLDEALYRLSAAGPRIVCVTDGGKGAHATDGEQRFFCPSLPCVPVDTTGAGDAFGTGFTWAIATGMDLPTALKAGTINAKSVVSTVGAQTGLLTHTAMHSQLASHAPTVEQQSL